MGTGAISPEDGGKPKLALIAGPTASGKSDLAVRIALLAVARSQSAVVINADSAQVYRDLQVLSARPTEEDMRGVPHRLFGEWDAAEACSAADWAAAAKREIENAHLAGALPILVGGTGLYIRTLLDGIAPIPPIDDGVRAEVRNLPVEEAYRALEREDPERHAVLNAGDSQRIARALEVVRSTGRTLAEWQRHKTGGIGMAVDLRPIVLLPDREWVNARCDRRFELMMENGAVEEVQALLARGLPTTLPAMRAIGVPEIADYLSGASSREDAIAAAQLASRQYARRQYTWLRNQCPSDWPRLDSQNISEATLIETIFQD